MHVTFAQASIDSGIPSRIAIDDIAVELFAAGQPAPVQALTAGEKLVADRLGKKARLEFLRGRAAQKSALAALGLDTDTSTVRMPHRNHSLTHAGDIAVSAYTSAERVQGVGVDFEPHANVNADRARFFLTQRELQTWPDVLNPDHAPDLLRLWTVKEALYKATADNDGLTVRDYTVLEPWAWNGCAVLASRPELRLRYVTTVARGGYLTVAATIAPLSVEVAA
jgi:phosphopantetheinyl transferase (holo-ACP synthase)